MIYLDNAATTQVDPEVLEAMLPYLSTEYGNPGTIYKLGRNAASAVTNAREEVACLINCKPEQIIFTSGGSEANSLAITGVKDYLINKGKKSIITTKVEHKSVLKAVEKMNIKDGFGVNYINPRNDGRINFEEFFDTIQLSSGLVSVMHTNNELGSQNPIYDIGNVCFNRNVLFHTDCVQGLGSTKIDVSDLRCDFLSMSGHKIGAPKGIGALFARDKSFLNPIIFGGANQEYGFRGGTENVANIVGFGTACKILREHRDSISMKMRLLTRQFLESLRYNLEIDDLYHIMHLNSSDRNKIISVRFDNVDAQTLVLMLDSHDVYVSAGSACRSNDIEPSYVLISSGLSDKQARETIRISMSYKQSIQEAVEAGKHVAECVKILYSYHTGE